MPPSGFEPEVPASEPPQTYSLDRAVTGIRLRFSSIIISCRFIDDIGTCGRVQAIENVGPPLPTIALIACTGTKLPLIFTLVQRAFDRSGWTWQIVCPPPPKESPIFLLDVDRGKGRRGLAPLARNPRVDGRTIKTSWNRFNSLEGRR